MHMNGLWIQTCVKFEVTQWNISKATAMNVKKNMAANEEYWCDFHYISAWSEYDMYLSTWQKSCS